MCGIIGCGIIDYVGECSCRDILFRGLRKVEYRGYDSAGILLVKDGAPATGACGE
jgi:glucosamine--fructose-6-phosphate aminotransferase (isomerizing)